MLNVGNWLSPCRRLGVSPLVRPPIFDKLIQWACGSPKTLDDGTVIIEDKKGKSGVRAGREQIPSAAFVGDASRWIDCGAPLLPALDDFEFTVDGFYSTPRDGLIEQYDPGQAGRIYFAVEPGNVLRIFFEGTGVNSTLTVTPGQRYVFKLERVNGVFNAYVDDVLYVTLSGKETDPIYQGNNTAVGLNIGADAFEGEFYKAELVDSFIYNFQDSNTNTYCYDASGNDNHGEIQNATGADRVESDNIAIGDMDSNGYTLARALGKNLFNKSTVNVDFNLDSSGQLTPQAGINTSDYILVEELTEYIRTASSANRRAAYYEKDKTFILREIDIIDEFTTPSNARFVRFTWNPVGDGVTVDEMQLEQGTTTTTYEAWDGYYRRRIEVATGKNLLNTSLLENGTLAQTTGQEGPSATDSRSGYVPIDELTEYTLSGTENTGGNNTRVYQYTLDGEYLGFIDLADAGGTFTTVAGTELVRVRYGSTNISLDIQIELGDIATAYEPFVGGEYVRDFRTPVLDGELSPVIPDGNSTWYDSNGDRAVSQFTGLLKADLRVVDGLIDNGRFYENWTDFTSVAKVENNKLVFENVPVSPTPQALNYSVYNVKENTQYTMKYRISDSDATVTNIFLSSAGITGSNQLQNTDGIYTITFFTDAVFSTDYIRIVCTNGNGTESISFELLSWWEGTVSDEPESGQPIIGNSVIQATTRYDLIQADDLTTTDMYDTTDVDNAEALVVPITGDVSDNPLFIREAPFCWLLYNETLDATEEEKVEKFLGF